MMPETVRLLRDNLKNTRSYHSSNNLIRWPNFIMPLADHGNQINYIFMSKDAPLCFIELQCQISHYLTKHPSSRGIRFPQRKDCIDDILVECSSVGRKDPCPHEDNSGQAE